MISKEEIDNLRAAQQAIDKLETTGSIVSGSPEHHALVWAIVRLTDEMLFDKRQLTDEEIAGAKRVIATIKHRGKKHEAS